MKTYAQMTRAQLEEQFRRADLPPGDRQKVSEELTRRIVEDLFGEPGSAGHADGGRTGAGSAASEQHRQAPTGRTPPRVDRPTASTLGGGRRTSRGRSVRAAGRLVPLQPLDHPAPAGSASWSFSALGRLLSRLPCSVRATTFP
jgi:hypothetical protein